ncbi:RNA polymerase sigma factor [Chitinophaga sp. GCM10012297]|uniref:Sigma-70 family RNA polymerase sigma factor n=1 Tax=Chitinophaga chungangae TaxID=2821488 RepID=A0ABS3YCI9_9BACT|nr:sigma-70 family RNA polymerase sigma factor [Chitinophaga chungangae]MBO9152402.1 sigma-70 family RNA polymerase sigma factor [Chitinophaga chungangae]
MNSNSSESALCRRMAAGDESAFASLYEIYQPKLHLFVYPLTGFSLPDTHEVVQDIFIKLWLRKETLVNIVSLQAYLFTMARNRLSDLRTQQAQQRKAIETLQLQQSEAHSDVQENLQLREYHRIARALINRLPKQKRRIFILRNEQGLSLDEIAAELNITKFAVKKQLYEATWYLKACLSTHADLKIGSIILIFNILHNL